MFLFFFFNDTATTEIYTLSLHDALPILQPRARLPAEGLLQRGVARVPARGRARRGPAADAAGDGGGASPEARLRRGRSEEHTSELQSQSKLVCRLLLGKKKNTHNTRMTS